MPRLRAGHLLVALALVAGLAGGLQAKPPAITAHKPFPELDRLPPGASFTVVQGSYDWGHNGHMALLRAAASDRTQDGPIFAIVTARYVGNKKPFLAGSYERRLRLLEEAVQEDPQLRGRVIVSRAASVLLNRPDELVAAISASYPGRRFSYVLGADSFNDSAKWPWFRSVEENPQVDLVAVNRRGYPIERPERAARVLRGSPVRVSSTEVRARLQSGDIEPLRGRVPPSTMRGLEEEVALRARDRPAGRIFLAGPSFSDRPFTEVSQEIPAGAHDVIGGVDEAALPEPVRVRLVTAQELVNATRRALDGVTLHASGKAGDPTKGHQEKEILYARAGGRVVGWYLFKPVGRAQARKLEALSTMANLLGVATPLAMPFTFNGRPGVVIPWTPGLVPAKGYDFTKATARVHESLLVSRWFSETLANQDVWFGQFLRPASGPGKWDELLHIDHDDAFVRRDPLAVQQVIRDVFKIDPPPPLKDLRWTNKPFRFKDALDWDPQHYDSPYTMFGGLWRDYVLGRVDIDLARVKERLSVVKGIPRPVLLKTLAPWLDATSAENWGTVPVRAADRFIRRGHFEKKVLARIYRSIDEYGLFLDRMAAARQDPASEIHRFYAAMPEHRSF